MGTNALSRFGRRGRMLHLVMLAILDPAEDLPMLYRSLLDAIAELERHGAYREATLVRAEATEAYSTAWDETGRRRLDNLARRVHRSIEDIERPQRAWSLYRAGADGVNHLSRAILHRS